MDILKLAIDGAIGAVKIAEAIAGAVNKSEAQSLAEVRERLEAVRERIEALPVRAGDDGAWARRADERRREIDGDDA